MAKAREALFLQLLELPWRRSRFKERAHRGSSVVLVVAVHADSIVVGAVVGLALSCMRVVVGREVGACTLTAPRFPGVADSGGMTPLETSGALAGG